jgi:hypothetical protein
MTRKMDIAPFEAFRGSGLLPLAVVGCGSGGAELPSQAGAEPLVPELRVRYCLWLEPANDEPYG